MFISDLPLMIDKFNCLEVANALSNVNIMHRAVVSSVSPSEDERGKAIWRIDQIARTPHLIIVSENRPSSQSLREALKQEEDIQIKPYDSYIEKASVGTEWVFMLRGNVTKTKKFEQRTHKVPIKDYQGQLQWLEKKGKNSGFELIGLPTIEKEYNHLYRDKEKGNKATFYGLDFTGRLRVTNTEKFRKALCEGIGRARSFGFGLLTIAPINNV